MAKKQEPQTYEVAEYSDPALDINTAFAAIKQIFTDVGRKSSQFAVWADWTGDMLKVHYHSYEMFLPEKMREVEDRAAEVFKNTEKLLKKEFKERTGSVLKLTPQKELSDSSREKVSLNQRFYFKAWRFYKISF